MQTYHLEGCCLGKYFVSFYNQSSLVIDNYNKRIIISDFFVA